ncbi:MAG TPA: tRNA uridine-5-carboxymethylaminomethyl(34) synthesis GTPase MnmE, partial [Sphingomonadales bacterium]|nr:tRNA uridine-5-carboxymethylaminomethyl(34) synthesis GTPase MnmE [Sphingomonadales bacterium]
AAKDYKPDTIFALASGKGRAGVAVLRLSGPKSTNILELLTKKNIPAARTAHLADFFDPETSDLIDSGVTIWFKGPKSFTGEDVAELHVHGGNAILSRFYNILDGLEGVRAAEPGEFSRRAFEHGKMDLTQAEGLNDLVLAETEAQRKQALSQLRGALSEVYGAWRATLLTNLAKIEAVIDFSEEEIPENLLLEVKQDVRRLKTDIEARLADWGRGEAIRSGYRIAIVGSVNVGKSSLLNALACEEKAIVSDIPGTTRDVIEVHMDLGGYSAILLDTAGLRRARGPIEAEGVKRAEAAAKTANLRLVLVEAKTWPKAPKEAKKHIGEDGILVLTKADLTRKRPKGIIAISSKTGKGLKRLLRAIERRMVLALEAAEPPVITRARHRKALEEAISSLDRFLKNEESATDPAILAEELRMASRALGRVTGAIAVEEVLGEIFSRFCIGK